MNVCEKLCCSEICSKSFILGQEMKCCFLISRPRSIKKEPICFSVSHYQTERHSTMVPFIFIIFATVMLLALAKSPVKLESACGDDCLILHDTCHNLPNIKNHVCFKIYRICLASCVSFSKKQEGSLF